MGCGSDDDSDDITARLASCRDITTSGRYVLDRDLTSDRVDATCLAIHDAIDVSLDCNGHTITGFPAVALERVQGFRVEDCRLASVAAGPIVGLDPARPTSGVLRIRDSADGIVTRVAVGPPDVLVIDAERLTVTESELDTVYSQFASQHVRVANNRMTNPFRNNSIGGVYSSSYGTANEVVGNTIAGGWDGASSSVPGVPPNGADDGILLFDEHDAYVAENVISDVFDCGIETVGLSAGSTFARNRIRNAQFCGIGGWHWSSVRDDVFASNTVVGSCFLFAFYRQHGFRPQLVFPSITIPADDKVYFERNTFDENRIEDVTPDCNQYAATIPIFDRMAFNGTLGGPAERVPGAADFALVDNVFRNNNFGTMTDPVWFGDGAVVAGLVIDGGGNRCRQPTASDYPLRCR
jgi:hypothetical protein